MQKEKVNNKETKSKVKDEELEKVTGGILDVNEDSLPTDDSEIISTGFYKVPI